MMAPMTRRLLIVDDDPMILAAMEAGLGDGPWTIETASDAMSAFIKARDLRPFLIISDVQMPSADDGSRALASNASDPHAFGLLTRAMQRGWVLMRAGLRRKTAGPARCEGCRRPRGARCRPPVHSLC